MLGIAGVAAPVAALFVVPIWAFPDTGDSGSQLVDWVAQHQTGLQVVMVLNTVGVTLWLAFAGVLRARMRAALPATSALPELFGSGMAVTVALLLAGFTSFDVLVYRADQTTPDDARVLYDLTFGLLAMSGMPTAVALTAFALAVTRHRMFPSWLGVLAGVAAVAHVALLASLIVPSGVASLESWPIVVIPGFLFGWILATGVVLARRGAPASGYIAGEER